LIHAFSLETFFLAVICFSKGLPKQLLQGGAITVLALVSYAGLRSLPDSECAFLHYEVVEVRDDGIELCSVGPHGFRDLVRQPFPVSLQWEHHKPLRAGERSNLSFRILGPTGMSLRGHELAITHTERVHLFLVHDSLRDYQHVHPVVDLQSDSFSFDFVPKLDGRYRLYAEFVPVRTRRQAVAVSALEVTAAPGTEMAVEPEKMQWPAFLEGDLEIVGGTARARVDNRLVLRLQRRDGGPLHLEELMDSYVHLVAFDVEGRGLAHMHTLESSDPSANPARMEFVFQTPHPGPYQLWAQFQIDGEEIFAPFSIDVL